MERIKHVIELVTKEHGLLSILSIIPIALFRVNRQKESKSEPNFLGDNAPYNIIDKLKTV